MGSQGASPSQDHGKRLYLAPAPIALMLALSLAVAVIIIAIDAAVKALPPEHIVAIQSFWLFPHLVHLPQFLIPFAAILYLSRWRCQEYGFNVREDPPIFTHKHMLALGLIAGAVLSIRHVIAALSHEPLDIPQPVTPSSVIGSLAFQWIVVGLAEETMFRGLIQTYLMNTLKGNVKILGHDFHVGTVIAAVIWGAFHLINVLVMPLGSAIFTAIVTTVAGLLMGYAYQRTRSLLTTIIVHNTMFGVPLAVGYILHAFL